MAFRSLGAPGNRKTPLLGPLVWGSSGSPPPDGFSCFGSGGFRSLGPLRFHFKAFLPPTVLRSFFLLPISFFCTFSFPHSFSFCPPGFCGPCASPHTLGVGPLPPPFVLAPPLLVDVFLCTPDPRLFLLPVSVFPRLPWVLLLPPFSPPAFRLFPLSVFSCRSFSSCFCASPPPPPILRAGPRFPGAGGGGGLGFFPPPPLVTP